MDNDVFTARSKELGILATALAGKPGSALVVGGSPGVGKSRTVRIALERNGSMIGRSYWVGATRAAASIPFGAVAQLIGPSVGRLDRYQILRRTVDRLAAATSGGKTVIVVDDAHLLDRGSAALVHFLAEAGTALVIATLRTGEPVPDAVTALWKEGRGEYLAMEPLDRKETGDLVAGLLHGPMEPVSASRIWGVVQGNPLYARELVHAALAEGDLVLRDGYWHWSGSSRSLPRLAQLIDRRMEIQPAKLRKLTDLLAYAGSLETELLERCGCSASLLESAERQGMVRSLAVGAAVSIQLAHPLFAESAQSGMSQLHRRAVAQVLVKAADAMPAVDPVRRAVWQLDSGGAVDHVLMGSGADRAVAALDLPLAERLATAAVAAGAGLKTKVLLARVLVLHGGALRAEELLADLLEDPLDSALWAGLTAQRAWNMVFGLEEPARADAILGEALSRDLASTEILVVQRASIMTYAGQPARALASLEAPLGSPQTDAATLAQAYTVSAEASAVSGDLLTAIEHGRTAVDRHRRMLGGDWSMASDEAESALIGALLLEGELDEAQERIERSYERSRDAGWAMGTGMWSVWRAEAALARGRVTEAEAHYRQALAASHEDLHPFLNWQKRFALDHLAAVLAMAGDAEAAAVVLERADLLARPWLGALDAWNGSAHAWLAAARGDTAMAIRLAMDLAAHAGSRGQLGWETLALHQVVRLGGAPLVLGRLEELSALTTGRVSRLYLAHAAGLTRQEGTRVLEAATGFHALGMELLAAEAAAQARDCFLAAGDVRGAATAGEWSREWAAICQGAATPALRPPAGPSRLTAREVQIAGIAEGGSTNREIASQLGISPRTVENILHHVYEKLHLRGRTDLPKFPVHSWERGAGSGPE